VISSRVWCRRNQKIVTIVIEEKSAEFRLYMQRGDNCPWNSFHRAG
jgi:hypothetical protein